MSTRNKKPEVPLLDEGGNKENDNHKPTEDERGDEDYVITENEKNQVEVLLESDWPTIMANLKRKIPTKKLPPLTIENLARGLVLPKRLLIDELLHGTNVGTLVFTKPYPNHEHARMADYAVKLLYDVLDDDSIPLETRALLDIIIEPLEKLTEFIKVVSRQRKTAKRIREALH